MTHVYLKSDKEYTTAELMPSGSRYFHLVKSKIATGKNKNGTPFYESHGYEYFETPVGEIELSEWVSLIKGAFEREGKTALFNAITEYCKGACPWLKKQTELELHAAQCLIHGSYKAWSDFRSEE